MTRCLWTRTLWWERAGESKRLTMDVSDSHLLLRLPTFAAAAAAAAAVGAAACFVQPGK
jgi:hypothetical protein